MFDKVDTHFTVTYGICYNTRRVAWWGLKQAMRGFKGVSGSF